MINFVVYFSTAQDRIGYVVQDHSGTALSDFTGGPSLRPGTYRVEGRGLTLVSEVPMIADELLDEDEEQRQWASLSRSTRSRWMAENPYE